MKDREPIHSTDTITGWLSHYDCLKRWQDRAEKAAVGGTDDILSLMDGVDFALAFFIWAHSLREWLINDKAINQDKLDSILRKHDTWSMCRDLANRSRHFDLKHRPRDKNWSLQFSFEPLPEQMPGIQKYRWIIFYDGECFGVFQLIRDIRVMWDEVLAETGLADTIKHRLGTFSP